MAEVQRFRADIQGLRALAIVPVVLYHSHRDWMPGGYIGVDIFFVISGYLITSIILKEIAAGRYSVLGFYERRVRRLFPALFLLLAAVLAAGVVLLPPPQLEALGGSTLAALLFVANFYYLQTADYFGEAAEYLPLIHTWSLAVEEQFYIAFPLLVFALRGRPRLLLALTAGGAVLSLIACIWMLGQSPTTAFYLPVTRAFELLIGAGIAIGIPRFAAPAAVRDGLSLAGLAILAMCFALYDDNTPFPGFAALLPCVATAAILLAGQDGSSRGGRLISSAPFVFFGNISYSLYLWHWPVLAFGRYWTLGHLEGIKASALVAASVALAWLSWRYVERPVLRARLSARQIFGGALAGGAAIAGAAAALMLSAGLPARFSASALTAQDTAASAFSPRRGACHYRHDRAFDYARSCVLGTEAASPTQAVWADSFGAELAYVLGERARANGASVRQLTASSCSPALDGASSNDESCTRFNAAALEGLVQENTIRTVFIAGHYLAYDVTPESYVQALESVVTRLLQAGKRVVIVYPVPLPRFNLPAGLAILHRRGGDPAALGADARAFAAQGSAMTSALDLMIARTGAEALRPQQALCDDARCRVVDEEGRALYFDDRHLSPRGVEVLLDATWASPGNMRR